MLELAYEQRPPHVQGVIDAELANLAKSLAAHVAIREIGPPMPGGMWAWGDRDLTGDTQSMAQAIGSRFQPHNGSVEDRAVEYMQTGRAERVSGLDGVHPNTQAVADHLLDDPRYQAYIDALRIGHELRTAAQAGDGSGLSPVARLSLIEMVEGVAEGRPSNGIAVLDRDGCTTGRWFRPGPDPDGDHAAQAFGEVRRGNTRIRTLARTAAANEPDLDIRSRLVVIQEYLSLHTRNIEDDLVGIAADAPTSPPPVPRFR